jgi:conjugal transfer pilus assembly protein TraV
VPEYFFQGVFMQKIIFIISISVLLTSCAEMNSNFDCPLKPGTRCESLDQVNARIDRGEIGHDEVSCQSCQQKRSMGSIKNIDLMVHKENEPLRYSESVMRVWIAPFEDTSGNYHQESEIFTVVKPAHWRDDPPHAVFDQER